jgi:hypothetical protein
MLIEKVRPELTGFPHMIGQIRYSMLIDGFGSFTNGIRTLKVLLSLMNDFVTTYTSEIIILRHIRIWLEKRWLTEARMAPSVDEFYAELL